jgi:hypothetical protein
MKVVLFLGLLLSLSGISFAQPAVDTPAPIIDEIFLAKAGADGKAGEAAEQFNITDVPIFCVVRLHTPGVASVKMDLIAANVAGVKPGSKVVSTSYTTRADEDRVNFKGRPQGLWVVGRYRVDIYVDDKKVRNIEFDIKSTSTEAGKPSTPKPPSRKPSKRTTSSDAVSRNLYRGASH